MWQSILPDTWSRMHNESRTYKCFLPWNLYTAKLGTLPNSSNTPNVNLRQDISVENFRMNHLILGYASRSRFPYRILHMDGGVHLSWVEVFTVDHEWIWELEHRSFCHITTSMRMETVSDAGRGGSFDVLWCAERPQARLQGVRRRAVDTRIPREALNDRASRYWNVMLGKGKRCRLYFGCRWF